jgi:hypothetical protein
MSPDSMQVNVASTKFLKAKVADLPDRCSRLGPHKSWGGSGKQAGCSSGKNNPRHHTYFRLSIDANVKDCGSNSEGPGRHLLRQRVLRPRDYQSSGAD